MKSLFFAALLFPMVTLAQPGQFVKDPSAYAVKSSKLYAEGDWGAPDGWKGCFSDSNFHITCTGTTKVLVFGGHWSTVDFQCEYQFRPAGQGYQVLSENCD